MLDCRYIVISVYTFCASICCGSCSTGKIKYWPHYPNRRLSYNSYLFLVLVFRFLIPSVRCTLKKCIFIIQSALDFKQTIEELFPCTSALSSSSSVNLLVCMFAKLIRVRICSNWFVLLSFDWIRNGNCWAAHNTNAIE